MSEQFAFKLDVHSAGVMKLEAALQASPQQLSITKRYACEACGSHFDHIETIWVERTQATPSAKDEVSLYFSAQRADVERMAASFNAATCLHCNSRRTAPIELAM